MMPSSHVSFILVHAITAHPATVIAHHIATLASVWLHVVHEHVCPSPDYGPPVETEEAGDEDGESVAYCDHDNSSRLDILLVLFSLRVVLLGVGVVDSWVAPISICAILTNNLLANLYLLANLLANLLELVVILLCLVWNSIDVL